MFTYESFIRQDTVEGQDVNTYGIRVYKPGQAAPVMVIPHISTDEGFVEDLVEKCNAGNLDPIHLQDVVDDALAGYGEDKEG